MAQNKDEGKTAWRDLQRSLLFPLLLTGSGVGIYGSNVIVARLDAEIEARKLSEAQIAINFERHLSSFDRHMDGDGHSRLAKEVAILREKIDALERRKNSAYQRNSRD